MKEKLGKLGEPGKLGKAFTRSDVENRDLVIRMLKHEEQLATSTWGQDRYKDPHSRTSVSLDNEYAFNRRTLLDFGYDTSESSVANYRSIFRTYFTDPDNYDKEVIGASYYMRNNRCVFYRGKQLEAGDLLPNCRLYMSDGSTETDLHSAIRGHRGHRGHRAMSGLICAYSNS